MLLLYFPGCLVTGPTRNSTRNWACCAPYRSPLAEFRRGVACEPYNARRVCAPAGPFVVKNSMLRAIACLMASLYKPLVWTVTANYFASLFNWHPEFILATSPRGSVDWARSRFPSVPYFFAYFLGSVDHFRSASNKRPSTCSTQWDTLDHYSALCFSFHDSHGDTYSRQITQQAVLRLKRAAWVWFLPSYSFCHHTKDPVHKPRTEHKQYFFTSVLTVDLCEPTCIRARENPPRILRKRLGSTESRDQLIGRGKIGKALGRRLRAFPLDLEPYIDLLHWTAQLANLSFEQNGAKSTASIRTFRAHHQKRIVFSMSRLVRFY